MARNYLALYLSLLFLINIGCQESQDIPQVESGRIFLRLTDAPFPHHMVSEVNITISKVIAKGSTYGSVGEDTSVDWELSSIPLKVNLLQLTNGVTVTLANTDIPAGSYSGLVLFIREATVRLMDNSVLNLNLGTRNGNHFELFIPRTMQIKAGLTSDLLLDFDVSRSFIPRYSNGSDSRIAGFIFKPFVKLSDAFNSGSITGIVTSSLENKISRLEGAQISIIAGNTLVTTTFTDFSGTYTVLGLDPGSYDIQADMKGFDTQIMSDVMVKAQKQTKQGVLLTNLE